MTAWRRFWFTPRAPEHLALGRIVLFTVVLVLYGFDDLSFLPDVAALRWRPISFFAWIVPDGPPSAAVIEALQWGWRLALIATIAGLWTRVVAPVAALLGLFLIGLPYCASRMSHEMAAAGLAMLVVAAARSGDALSLDRWRAGAPVPPSPEHHWPVQLIRALISVAFFAAGLSKLRYGGLDWITSDNLQLYLGTRDEAVGLALAEHPLLCRALAAVTVVVELFHPLALVSRRAAMLWVPAGLACLVGFHLSLGASFWALMAIHLFWLPWPRAGERPLEGSRPDRRYADQPSL